MILREIALAAPFRTTSELASVGYDSRVICALIVKAFGGRIRPPDFWKISIRINHDGEHARFEMLDRLLVVYRDFQITEYLGLTSEAQQGFLLDFIGTVLHDVFEAFGLPTREIDEALIAVRDSAFENTVVSRKWTSSPSRKRRARVECIQRFRTADIFVYVETEGRMITRPFIVQEKPDEFIFGVWFNRLEWVDENHLRVLAAHGRIVDVQVGMN